MARRTSGEGGFEKLPSGKWRFVQMVDGKRLKGPARKTKQEARSSFSIPKKAPEKESPSFKTVLRSHLDRSSHLSPTTADTYHYWTLWIERDPIGDIPATEINTSDLHSLLNRMKSSIGSPHTIKKRYAWYCSILTQTGNYCRKPAFQSGENPRRPLGEPEVAEAMRIFSEAPEKLKLAFLLCYGMGLRRGEACGLRHEDRDGDGILIQRTVVVSRSAIHIKLKGKTVKSNSWLPLPPFLRDVIGKGEGFVLGKGEVPCHPKTLSGELKELFKGSSVERVPHLGFHTFRRTFGMKLLMKGIDLRTASELMRHDPQMLLREYTKSSTELKSKAVDDVWGKDLPA